MSARAEVETPRPEVASADTLSERAALLVQRDILSGRLQPGARLGIVDLAGNYGVGATPLREGLSRLVSQGLVVALGQRGFRVASVSESDLRDITEMRVVVEKEALLRAMKKGGDDWEAGVLAALHRLSRYVERAGSKFGEGKEEFDVLHKSFHTSLLGACGSPRLLAAHSSLYDEAYRYRRVMMRAFEDGADFVRTHRELADVVVARDARRAPPMLAEHLKTTIRVVYPDEERMP
jgi:DNA-binding GntR family transcriptional regulator